MTSDGPDRAAATPAQRRRDRERAAARDTILAAAHDVARRDGWQAVTMRRLADEIDYSANFAYRYFTGRDDILLALVRDGFRRLHDAMAAAAAAPGDGTAHGDTAAVPAIRRAAHAYLDFALTEAELYQLMYGLDGVRVPAADAWDDGQAVGDLLGALLTAAGDTEPGPRVLRLWATAHGLVALRAVGRVVADGDGLHALLDDALTDGLARLRSDDAPPPPPTRGTPPP
ncbi:TetR/AcrR family transcriptional regulator [Pseudonocardia broussonetiae]|uniref:TetR/AcrR family transcriptional regulator n=1 Tax=Pseudonocardia broussonetiae TaxID=2736640 RepID=A0A6M6JSB9_9PSEU|nr:TetR/AcrR family transcriptional regulator [Pseudonocardia broussonetiae]QJY49917.1 TetR/AcrR family transcriptional regulator [Pseudonocardia broussonetiae]